MAMCVMAVVAVAPCQCFSPEGNQITSPGRISSTGPPQRCAQPQPDVTIKVCPSGCVCQAVRAPGSNVTLATRTRAGSGASNSGSMRTVPVKYSVGPLPEGCEPILLISIFCIPSIDGFVILLNTTSCPACAKMVLSLPPINPEPTMPTRILLPLCLTKEFPDGCGRTSLLTPAGSRQPAKRLCRPLLPRNEGRWDRPCPYAPIQDTLSLRRCDPLAAPQPA